MTLTPASARAEYVTVSTILTKPFKRQMAARYQIAPSTDGGGLAAIAD